ncbi:MAG: 50S ribosomal protein L28 [bacterium]
MAFKCDICGKGGNAGNAVSHSNRKTRRVQYPNLHTMRVVLPDGSKKKVKVCTRCLRSEKVKKAV